MASLRGTASANHIIGTASADTILGFGGSDSLEGRGGNDVIDGGAGNDTINGGVGADRLTGGLGSDTFLFARGDGKDVVTDFASGDLVMIPGYSSAQSLTQVGTGVVLTLSATDKITFSNASLSTVRAGLQFGGVPIGGGTSGGTPGVTITGTSGGDTLNGTAGNDTIIGLGGYDVINGGAGNDRIYGGLGGDKLIGGAGADVFAYSSVAEGPPYGLMYWENDTIADFQSIDKIDLSALDADPTVAGQQHFHFVGYYDSNHLPVDHSAGALYIYSDSQYCSILGFVGGTSNPFFVDITVDSGQAHATAANLIL